LVGLVSLVFFFPLPFDHHSIITCLSTLPFFSTLDPVSSANRTLDIWGTWLAGGCRPRWLDGTPQMCLEPILAAVTRSNDDPHKELLPSASLRPNRRNRLCSSVLPPLAYGLGECIGGELPPAKDA
jgi:hypothetical protein